MIRFHPGARRCPWLESGLYVNNQGVATGCCMIKDTQEYALGRFGVDPPELVLARRDAVIVLWYVYSDLLPENLQLDFTRTLQSVKDEFAGFAPGSKKKGKRGRHR